MQLHMPPTNEDELRLQQAARQEPQLSMRPSILVRGPRGNSRRGLLTEYTVTKTGHDFRWIPDPTEADPQPVEQQLALMKFDWASVSIDDTFVFTRLRYRDVSQATYDRQDASQVVVMIHP